MKRLYLFNTTKIPAGDLRPVRGTPHDFRVPHSIEEKLWETYENTVLEGYDHSFVLDNKEKVDAMVYDPVSGRPIEVLTDQPGMQFYSGTG